MHKTQIYNKMEYLQRKYAYNHSNIKNPQTSLSLPNPTSAPIPPCPFYPLSSGSQSVVPRQAVSASPGNCVKMQGLRPYQNLLKQNLCFWEPPRWSWGTEKFEKYYPWNKQPFLLTL